MSLTMVPPGETLTRPGTSRRRRMPTPWTLVSIVLFLVIWAIAATLTNRSNAGLVPAPWTVAHTLWQLTTTSFAGMTLLGHVASSLGRWGLGFGFALVLGGALGLALGAFTTVRAAVTPLFEFLRYIPPFAWIPLAVLWMGATQTSAAFIVFVAAFPAVVISTQTGVSQIDPSLLKASRVLGASRLRTLRSVIAPLAVPAFLTGARVAVSNGWMAVVAAELISGTEGVGFLISQGQENGNVAVVMAGMVAIGITGTIIDALVNMIDNRLTRWRKSNAQAR